MPYTRRNDQSSRSPLTGLTPTPHVGKRCSNCGQELTDPSSASNRFGTIWVHDQCPTVKEGK